MRINLLSSGILAALLLLPLQANTLLYKDNFDTADTPTFDTAPLTGRLTGSLAATVFPKSAKAQQTIAGNQLRMIKAGNNPDTTGRVRFMNTGGRHDWASGTEGATILTDGGMRVEFDWTPPNTTGQEWIAFNIGHTAPVTGEPAFRVLDPGTDYAILLRNNGQSARFDNGAGIGNGTPYTPVAGVRHVIFDFAFTSFADGSTVNAITRVNGALIASESFTWAGNTGAIFLELETYLTGQLVDNFSISTLPAGLQVNLDDATFISGSAQGDLIGLLTAGTVLGGNEDSTFVLVAGAGDTHNARFQITGDRLEAGTYDFKQDPGGTQYFVRVRATGSVSGGIGERELVLTLIKDDDADGLLDGWENQYFPGDLTQLNGTLVGPGPGAGTGDFDNDGFSDLAEYNLSLVTYPGISPVLADSDTDGLQDQAETIGAGLRPPTSPIRADSDFDGLTDGAESNDGTYDGILDTGSNPMVPDTDLDGSRDGFEQQKGSNPVDFNSRPTLPAGFALVELTDDASSGISPTKTYTHLVAGAQVANVNGVAFQELAPLLSPPNFIWEEVGAGNKAVVLNNNNTWVPANGGVTGPGLLNLFDSFTYTTGGSPGQLQTYTLGGLTPGTIYSVRLYIRAWNKNGGSGRPLDLTFTNGTSVEVPFGGLKEDRPGLVLNNGNEDSAYYLSYTYVAQATELVIKAEVHTSSLDTPQSASGHFHLYALSNEVVPPAGNELVVTGVSWNGSGDFVIQFKGAASTTYEVTKSSNLVTPFGPLTVPLTAATDAGGVGQAVIPAAEASELSEFYRIEVP